MYKKPTPTFDRTAPTIDRDLFEASPSNGWQQVYAIFGVTTGVSA